MFEDAVQAKTSFVMPCVNSDFMNLSASRVPLLLMVTRACASWMKPPKHCRRAMRAMFESSSFDMPIPTGCPIAFSFGAALSTSCQVFGALTPT